MSITSYLNLILRMHSLLAISMLILRADVLLA